MRLEVTRDEGKQARQDRGLEGIDEIEHPDAIEQPELATYSGLGKDEGRSYLKKTPASVVLDQVKVTASTC